MKTISFFIILIFFSFSSNSQNITNPSFDSVYIGGIDRIFEWITSDAWPVQLNDTVPPLNPNDHYVSTGLQYHETYNSVQIEYSSAFHGPFAIKMLSDSGRVDIFGNPFRGFIVNGNHFYTDGNGYIDLNKCGTPFPHRPVKLIGHYKCVDNSPSLSNYPQAMLLLKKYNTLTQTADTIGFAFASMQLFPTGNWLAFEMPVTYISNQVPDSIVVAFFSPALGNASTLWVDSLGFEYSPTSIAEQENNSVGFYVKQRERLLCFKHAEDISHVKIYDLSGKLLLDEVHLLSSIDISKLKAGVYLFTLSRKGKPDFSQKFLLE